MKKASNYRVVLPLLAVAVAAIAFALTAGKSSAQGRTLDGSFDCGKTAGGVTITGCIDVKYGDTEAMGHGASRAPGLWPAQHDVLTIDPGTYWLAMVDDQGMHNIALRSCPGSDSACGPAGAPASDLTPICNDPTVANPDIPCGVNTEVDTTTKVLLKQGWYRLLCETPGHEAGGMYVDINVVGQD